MALLARWYDGHSSRPHAVHVELLAARDGPDLRLQPASGPAIVVPGSQVGWPERWSRGHAPRRFVVDLGARGSLEFDDADAWESARTAAGASMPLAQRMQTRWSVFLAVLVLAGLGLTAFYRWGTPWAAVHITRSVPLAWETSLSQRAMGDLDDGLLKPSRLPAARQAELRARFDDLVRQIPPALRRYAAYAPPFSLEFRHGLGANAFALPGGRIVMTDGMVEAAGRHRLSDDALIGVLAHEMGHVVHRHTTRMVVEQGVLNVGLGLALGDVSHLLSLGTSALSGLAYRRGHETEADCFAHALMRHAALPTAPMADLLLAVDGPDAGHDKRPVRKPGLMTLLSSHPETALRAERLKRGEAPECPR